MRKNTVRIGATVAAVAILVLGAPLAASAHVKVSPNSARAGDDIALTFRVPNESETAGTVKVEIDLPTKTPFAGADYDPVVGWSAQIVTQKLARPIKNDGVEITEAPVKVIFTADPGVQIKAGQFQEFALALDLTPNTGSVEFPVYQTYSDGTVVTWNEKTPASGEEPDNPAPTLYINDAPPASDGGGSGVGVAVTATDAANSTATSALILGSAGLAVAVIALVLAIFAFVRSRQRG
jgi:uncharacterized protein YcnI